MTDVDPERDLELSALLDGALDAASEARLRAELAASPALAARLAELAAVDEALRALPARELAAPALEDLRHRIAQGAPSAKSPVAGRSPRRQAPRRPSPWSPWRGGALAALGAAVAAALLLLAVPRLRGVGGAAHPTTGVAQRSSAGPSPAGGAAGARDEAALTRLAGEDDPSQLDSDLPVIGVLDVLQDLDDLPARSGRGGRS